MGCNGDNKSQISVLFIGYGSEIFETIRQNLNGSNLILTCGSDYLPENLNLLKDNHIDVIVSELCTEYFSATEMLSFFEREGIETPVIIFTRNCSEETVREVLSGGAEYFARMSGNPDDYFAELSGKIKYAAEKYSLLLQSDTGGKNSGISSKMLLDMLSICPDMISLHDREMNTLCSNRQGFTEISGDMVAVNSENCEISGGTDNFSPGCIFANALPTDEPFLKEIELPGDIFAELRVLPLFNRDNNIEYTVKWFRDITERKRADEELLRQKNLFEELINKIPDILAVQYPDHKIEYYNEAGYELLNMTPKEVKNRECYRLIGRDCECEECATRKAVISGKTEKVEKYVPEVGLYLECISIPVHDEEGNIVRIIEHLRDVTDAKKAETALRESEERYRTLFNMMRLMCDNVPDLIWAKDKDNHYTFANRAMCKKLLNASDTSEPIGKTDLFFAERERALHPDDPQWHTFGEICMDTDQITIDAGIPSQFDEYGNVRGEFLYLDVHKAPFLNEDGEMIGTVGSARDVTGIKRTEDKLLEIEKRIKVILDAINDGIWEWDIKSGVAELSPAWYKMLGFEPYELPPSYSTWRSLVHPDDLKYAEEKIMDCLNSGQKSYDFEFRMRRKDGVYRWIYARGNVISRDLNGKVLKMAGVHTDITDRRNTLTALAESERKYRDIFENSVSGLFKTTVKGEIFDANNYIAHMYGYSDAEEFLQSGLHANDLYADINDRNEFIRMVKDDSRLENYEVIHRKRDGTTFWVSVNCRVICDHDGGILFYEGSVVDITERKKAEEALDLAKRKLKILSGITRHDILNRITVIRGIIDMFGDLKDDCEKDKYLGEIYDAAVSIQENIYFTREYEKIGVKRPVWSGVFDLAHNRDIQIYNKCSGIEIYADSMVRKVFENLLDNTIMHSEGATEVNITYRMDESRDELIVTWEDNGAGVPDNLKETIFKRGFGNNTGFGLFLSREILSITGISIKENGICGEGAKFDLTFPAGSWRYKKKFSG